jgi:hypothetical protein
VTLFSRSSLNQRHCGSAESSRSSPNPANGLTGCASVLFTAHDLSDNERRVKCFLGNVEGVKYDYTFNSTCLACGAGQFFDTSGMFVHAHSDCSSCNKASERHLKENETAGGMYEAACKACAEGKVCRTGSRFCTDDPGKHIAANNGKPADVYTVMNAALIAYKTCCAIVDCFAMVYVAFDVLLCSDPGAAFLYEIRTPAGRTGLEVFCWKQQNLC